MSKWKARPHVQPIAEELEAPILMPCNVEREGELEAVFDADISDVDRRLILGGTARRLLALA